VLHSVKFRPQRGGLTESLAEVKEVNSLQELRDILKATNVEVRPYIYDERIDWNTYLVRADGEIVGFTDGPLT